MVLFATCYWIELKMEQTKNRYSRPGKQNGMYGVHRFGQDSPRWGMKHSKESNEKNRLKHLGVKLSEEHKEKLRAVALKGENSVHWRGGPKSYQRLRQGKVYRRWSIMVKERDNYTCQICGKRGGKIHADHIKTFYKYPELRLDMDNGRTLCVQCHYKTGTYGRISKKSETQTAAV